MGTTSKHNNRSVMPLWRDTRHAAVRMTQATLAVWALLLPIAAAVGLSTPDILMFATAIACSLIPYGLAAQTNMALSQAISKLAAERVLVKGSSTVAMLGTTDTILIDGIGTLDITTGQSGTAVGPAPRDPVVNAMDAARKAHIKVSIMTAGSAAPAAGAALRAGLVKTPRELMVVQGQQLRRMHDGEVFKLVCRGGAVFAQVTSDDRVRIIALAQRGGRTVAATGSGADEIAALARADVGIAMGMSGTDAVKRVADAAITDDRFTTLVGGIQGGRTALQNTRKGIWGAFTAHAAEFVITLLSLGAAILFHIPPALAIIQMLAVSLMTGLLPAAALGRDTADNDPMSDRTPGLWRGSANRAAVIDSLSAGLLMGGLAFINYLWFFERQGISGASLSTGSRIHMQATALTYLTLAVTQTINIAQRRTERGLFSHYQLHNRRFWLAAAFSLLLVTGSIHIPLVAPYFMAAPLGATDWLYALGAAAIFLLFREFQRHNRKHHRKAVVELHRRVRALDAN